MRGGGRPRDALLPVLDACAELDPERPWADLAGLALDVECERTARWLLDSLEGRPPPPEVEELWVRIHPRRWHGRPDGCELELWPGPPVEDSFPERDPDAWTPGAGALASPALAHLATLAHEESGRAARWLGELLPVTCAALVVRHAVERVDAAPLLGELDARGVSVGFAGGACVFLGWREERGWDESGFGRY